MTEKAINFAEKVFSIFLLLVILTQTVLILSMSRVRPADVVVEIKQLEDAIGVSNNILSAKNEKIEKDLKDINKWMEKITISIDENSRDRIYKEDIIQWIGQVKQMNPQIELPNIEDIKSSND